MSLGSNSSIQSNLWVISFSQDPDRTAHDTFLNLSENERQEIGQLGITFAGEVDQRLWNWLDLPQLRTDLTIEEGLAVAQAALAMTLKACRVLTPADGINLGSVHLRTAATSALLFNQILHCESFSLFYYPQALVWSHHDLETLPGPVEKFSELRIFILNDNRLESLPLWLKDLTHLKTLDVRNNPLVFDETLSQVFHSLQQIGCTILFDPPPEIA